MHRSQTRTSSSLPPLESCDPDFFFLSWFARRFFLRDSRRCSSSSWILSSLRSTFRESVVLAGRMMGSLFRISIMGSSLSPSLGPRVITRGRMCRAPRPGTPGHSDRILGGTSNYALLLLLHPAMVGSFQPRIVDQGMRQCDELPRDFGCGKFRNHRALNGYCERQPSVSQ